MIMRAVRTNRMNMRRIREVSAMAAGSLGIPKKPLIIVIHAGAPCRAAMIMRPIHAEGVRVRRGTTGISVRDVAHREAVVEGGETIPTGGAIAGEEGDQAGGDRDPLHGRVHLDEGNSAVGEFGGGDRSVRQLVAGDGAIDNAAAHEGIRVGRDGFTGK